jgi:hypothetical protein
MLLKELVNLSEGKKIERAADASARYEKFKKKLNCYLSNLKLAKKQIKLELEVY